MSEIYDVIIIGSGPAGLSAAIYAGRAKMNTLLIEKESVGGQITSTAEVENYPGCLEEESGVTLASRMSDQADKFGVHRVYDTVLTADLHKEIKEISCFGEDYYGKTVIIATGSEKNHLNVPGEEELTGAGVSYCATCDASFFEGLPVYVVGGGDAAVEEAMYLGKFASDITIIQNLQELTCAASIKEKALADPKLKTYYYNTVVKEIRGKDQIESIVIRNLLSGEEKELKPEDGSPFGLFIFIGLHPNTEVFEDQLKLERGYIRTDEEMRTEIPGVFAAGDVRVKSLRQVVTAVADGAIAAVNAQKYIESL